MPATVFRDLVAEAPVPARGILSQTLSNENGIELVLFAFAPGEQLSEQTSARPAIIHILSGEADLTRAGDADSSKEWVPADRRRDADPESIPHEPGQEPARTGPADPPDRP
jgi:hypothetical protein